MYGGGKSDRLIVAEKRSNKDDGAPSTAEDVEPSSLPDQREFVSANQVPDTVPERFVIWPTLNGHEARNRGHCQEIVPTSHLPTCNMRWSGYGRLPAGIRSCDFRRSGTMSTT